MLQFLAEGRADAAKLAVAKGVRAAALHHVGALESRAFGDDNHGVMAGVARAVDHHELGETADVERHLADQRPVSAGEEARDQRGLAAVAAEQLDHRDPLMAAGRRPQRMDELDAAAHGGREADAVVGAVDVIVHGLGDRHHRHAFFMEPRRIGQRVVAADRHQRVDTEMAKHTDHVVGAIHCAVLARLPAFKKVGERVGPNFAGIGARGMEDGAARAVDRARAVAGERHDGTRPGAGIVVRVERQRAGPTAPEADDLPAEILGQVDHRLDRRIETRDVAAAGENCDAHGSLSSYRELRSGPSSRHWAL